MRPAEFELLRPRGRAELDAILARPDADTYWLAGGQALLKDMRQRLLAPKRLVDISGLAELDYIRAQGDVLEIGAVTRLATLATDATVRRHCPALAAAAAAVGDVQIRNRATVGGNLCTGGGADVAVALLAAGAEIVVAGAGQQHRRQLADFLAGETAGNRGELIVAIRVPAAPARGFVKFSRRAADPGIVSAAATLGARPGLAFGGVHGHVVAPPADALPALEPGSAALRTALEAFAGELDPPDTPHASAAYRRRILAVIADRAVRAAAGAA